MKVDQFVSTYYYGFLAASVLAACSTSVLADSQEVKPAEIRTPMCPQPRATPQAPNKFLKMKNPLAQTDENMEAGAKLFLGRLAPIPCKTCHGHLGNGLGDPEFESKPASRNFTCAQTMSRIPDGQLFWVIKSGVPRTAMPSFDELTDDQVWRLILHIRQLGK